MNLKSLLRPLFAELSAETDGWASRSLNRSIRQTTVAVVAVWQVVMMLEVAATLGISGWPLLAAHGLLAAVACLILRRATIFPARLLPLAMATLGVAGYLASDDLDSVLVFAACWQLIFASCAAGLLIRRWWILPGVIIVAAGISGLIVAVRPGWGSEMPITIVVTHILIIATIRLGLPLLLSPAERADLEEEKAQQATRQAEVTHRVSRQIAEETRVLHDTAINTLGAIANGGAGTSDLHQVRQQCARDVTLLDSLRSKRPIQHPHDDAPGPALRTIFCRPGLPIQRLGLTDDELDRLAGRLDSQMIAGLVGAAQEAITNATKHSGASSVGISMVAVDDRLVIEISDDGAGFDRDGSQGLGLTRSIFGRARDCGFEARLHTSPGEGTTVTLTAALTEPQGVRATEQPTLLDNVEEVVRELHWRGGLVWSAGVTVVSLVLTAASRTGHSAALIVMIAIMAAVWIVARCTGPRRLRPWAVAAFTIATVIVFWLSAAATAFGTDNAVYWQALAVTGPFVLLMSYPHPHRATLVAGTVWGLAVLAIATFAAFGSFAGAAIVIVAGCVGIAFAAGWSGFQTAIAELSRETAAAQRRTFRAQLTADAERAAQETYRRWLEAGLDSAIDLLQEVAEGRRDPQRQQTRQACNEEEAYLRQLALITPELVHLGHTMMPLLRIAREQRTPLTLRLGGQDAPDEVTATEMSSAVADALASAAPDQNVTASVFPIHDGLQLTITRTTTAPEPLCATSGVASATGTHRLGTPELIQLAFPNSSDPEYTP